MGARAAVAQLRYGLKLARAIDPLRPGDAATMLRTLRSVVPFTGVDVPRLRDLWRIGRRIDASKVPGAIAQCGVWRGGSAAVAARAAPGRAVWLFDSFQGFPEPTEADYPGSGIAQGDWSSTPDDVRAAMRRVGADPGLVHIVEGWFDVTLPAAVPEIGPIALLSIDADLHASVLTALDHLYPLVTPGGFVVIDDYGFWPGCRRAVDEYLASRGEVVRMHWSDRSGVWFQKAALP